jgi:hypothetical protein
MVFRFRCLDCALSRAKPVCPSHRGAIHRLPAKVRKRFFWPLLRKGELAWREERALGRYFYYRRSTGGVRDRRYSLRKPHPADTIEKPPRVFGLRRRLRGHNDHFGWSGRNHVFLDEYWSSRWENFTLLDDYWPRGQNFAPFDHYRPGGENFAFLDDYRARRPQNWSFLNNCNLFWTAAACCEECAHASE